MKRVGILTYYYKNYNYGGSLQAYALTRYINAMGAQCEQIAYETQPVTKKERIIKFLQNKNRIAKLQAKLHRKHDTGVFRMRAERFDEFLDQIPHSNLYNDSNIRQTNVSYDIFITGSDQVWNPNWSNKTYFLEFVEEHKKIVSYSASIGTVHFTKEQQEELLSNLKKYDLISVRENEAVELVQKYTDQKVEVILDPTVLLAQDDWRKLERPVDIKTKYILCYMLGIRKENYEIIKKIGQIMNYKIVFISYAQAGEYWKVKDFGDIAMPNVGPAEFLSLIDHAEMIVTDSFHAAIFSIIFQKPFWTLKRSADHEADNMNIRIYTLLEQMGLNERILDETSTIEKTMLTEQIDYEKVEELLKVEIEKAKRFLEKALTE